jgi:GT2 family glycosyltransferase
VKGFFLGMAVSFIIPLYGALPLARECLRTLQVTLPPGLDHEIILVDDCSPDDTREWLATLPLPCRPLLNERNLGFAGACNRGAAIARGDLLFFLNSDLKFLRGWFQPMHALLRRSEAGLVGNVQLNARTGSIDHAGVFFDHKGKPAHETEVPPWERLRGFRTAPAVTGACFAIAADLWRQLGAFDEGFRNGGEDIDLALKARAAGRTNYVALRSVVRHHISASFGRKLRDEQNSCRLARRWRAEIATLALPAWCLHALSLRCDGARDPDDWQFSAALLAQLLGFARTPPTRARHGIRAALDMEEARWRELGLL